MKSEVVLCRVSFPLLTLSRSLYCRLNTAFVAVSCLMTISAALQLSLVSVREWAALFGRVHRWKRRAVRRLSRTHSIFATPEDEDLSKQHRPYLRTLSMPEDLLRTVTWKLDEQQQAMEKKDA